MSDVDLTPDTIPLAEACARLGIVRQTGGRLARAGEELIPGVPILRIGREGSGHPVYRVSRHLLDKALGVEERT